MNKCPYCGKLGNIYFPVSSRRYNRCRTCDLIYEDTNESYGNVVDTYRENYFDRHAADQLKEKRLRLYDHVLELIAENQRGGRLLDVGTGCGFFLVAAQERKWEAKGVEPSIQSVEVAQRQNGLDVFAGTLQEYDENSQFDVITFINVLEHSKIPWLEIDRARELLRPGGLIYLRFPNGSLHSRIYRLAHKCGLVNSVKKFLVFHKYSFTARHIRRLLQAHGFFQTTIQNSPPSEGDPYEIFPDVMIAVFIKKLIYAVAKLGEVISSNRLLLNTSLEAIALKEDNV